ncbi:MAG: hypothetical protein HY754_14095 [Nitrospirae bacterium]|nr:hypothetical protein [Nitrospirota bacterium]
MSFIIITVLYIQSRISISRHHILEKDLVEIVENLSLTDMVLSTDARYTRHPTQADLFSAFQDYPGSIEHFPTGSVIPPPDFSYTGMVMRIE